MLAIKSESTISSLECILCLETYKDPRILPCGHTFCLSCLQKLANSHLSINKYKCAFCRQEFGDIKLQELPKNFAILNVIASLPTVVECGSVGNGETHGNAEFFCIDCSEPLCSMCHDSHKRTKFTRNHVTKKVSEISEADIEQQNKSKQQMCSKHPKEDLKLYCEECDEIVCVLCNMTSHSKHSYLTLQEADTILQNKIKNSLEVFKQEESKIMKQTQELNISLSFLRTEEGQHVEDVKSFFNEIKTQMRREFETLFKSLESYEKETLQYISDIISTEKLELEKLSLNLKENLIKIKSNVAQHEDFLSLSKSTVEKSLFIKTITARDNIASSEMQHSLQYKIDGVAQWKNDFKQWLQPIHSSLVHINSTSPPFQANFMLSPTYSTSYTCIQRFSFPETRCDDVYYISLLNDQLLTNSQNTSDVYIYHLDDCQTTEL